MLRRTLLTVLAASLLLLHAAAPLQADQRDLSATQRPAPPLVPIAGDYWALIIGIDRYQHAPKLRSAVKDATGVRDVLVERYGFARERVIALLDEQATRTNIEQELYRLGQLAKPDDSVLIYYAGHGQYDDEGRLGWWVPVEGKPNQPGTFITNASIRDYIAGMKARHVYLVADSCFSGTLFGQRATMPVNEKTLAKLAAKRSRWGLTSGGTEPVADEGRAGHSVFAYHLITLLRENQEPYLVPSRIYAELLPLVGNNTDQTPRSEPLKGAGDEGGQFVFRLVSTSAAPLPSPPPPRGEGRPVLSPGEGVGEMAPPPKDVDVSGYDQYEALARLAEKREQAWAKVQAFAGKTSVAKEKRLAALDKFLSDFADDNPHAGEAEALKQRITAEMQVAGAPSYSAPKQAGREITGKDGAPMVLIPEGEFLYGDDNQRLSLPAFYMDKFEVTTKLYAAFMQATGRAAPERWNEVSQVSDGERPVIGVSWHDADAYCRYYGKRLPTEQEWEKAARGTDGRTYPWGNEEPTSQRANYGKCCEWKGYAVMLAAVESYEAGKSPYGLYHMAGNVWEWTSSDYGSDSKVVRGGSWTTEPALVRSADRTGGQPAGRHVSIGFRCAQDAR